MKLYKIIIFCLLLIFICSINVGAQSYSSIRNDYRELTASVTLQKKRTNWEKLIRKFSNFIQQNPTDPSLDKAMYLLGRTWDGLSLASGSRHDASMAITSYESMITNFPESSLADDALFHAGRTAETRLKNNSLAHQFYQKITTAYHDGDMLRQAQNRLASLRPVNMPPAQDRGTTVQHHDENIGSAPTLNNIRHWSGPKYTRIVLDLTAPVTTKPVVLKGDNPRIFFDLIYTKLGSGVMPQTPIMNGLVKQVRSAQFSVEKARVVIDLNRASEYRLNFLQNPYRIVVDILGSPTSAGVPSNQGKDKTSVQGRDDISTILQQHKSVPVPTLHVPQEQHDEGIHTIVVDAGHGGKDPGAVGPGKLYEKKVTLALAKELASQLRSKLGVKVLLTRSDDRFLELRERTAYANKVGADLFISLHANASKSSKAYGTETYFLNLSKNDKAAEVAARENGTSMQDVGNLEAILFDLMANAKINESSRLAAEVQQALMKGLKPHYSNIRDLGVKQGPFHVLLGATMPSVLVEAAFISNSREAKRLNSKNFQKRVANAIVEGVKQYSASIDQVAKR